MGIFDRFKGIKSEDFREGFQQPIKDGQAAVNKFESGLKSATAGSNDLGKALTQLQEGVSTAETALEKAQKSKAKNAGELVAAAEAKLAEVQTAQRDFLSGKTSVEVIGAKKPAPKGATKSTAKPQSAATKVEVKVTDSLKTSFESAETAAAKVTDPASSMFGTVRTQKDGWAKAVKNNWQEVKEFKPGTRGMAVARCGVVAGSAIAIGDALLRSKDSNGEDRSAAMRMAEFVVAGGVGTAALVSGRAMAR